MKKILTITIFMMAIIPFAEAGGWRIPIVRTIVASTRPHRNGTTYIASPVYRFSRRR